MRPAVFFITLLLLALLPISNTSQGLDSGSGITLFASFNEESDSTTIRIEVPITNDASLLDDLKETTFALNRAPNGEINHLNPIISGLKLCDETMSNAECSGRVVEFEYYPESNLVAAAPPNPAVHYTLLIEQDLPAMNVVASDCCIDEEVSPIQSVDNLTAEYESGITMLNWDYPENTSMNHSIMIYRHDSPATVENWNTLPKTIVTSSVVAGVTNYEVNHSGNSVEREVYYTVTLLYETSEDTRFLLDNTLQEPIVEDNVAPLFIGELTATFDANTAFTTVDWEAGLQDEDLVINIYRSSVEPQQIDVSTLVNSVDASLSSTQIQVPQGEHRQSWYAITLQDSEGNEVLDLTEASPVSDMVIESTIGITTVTGLSAERYGDGTIVISWDDDTNNPDAVARVWRSFEGPITSLQNVEELNSVNASNGQTSHNPVNPQDEAWYAVTIDAAWGESQEIWHDETLVLGTNSLITSIKETEDVVEEVEINFNSQILTTSGIRMNITDGAVISLGELDQNDIIVISTSYPVANISCFDIAGEGTSIHSEMDWALTFNANQSGEECGGLISDGEEEITFAISWDYIESQVSTNDGTTIIVEEDDEDEDEGDDEEDDEDENSEVAAVTILTIIILALVIYLVVMMRKQDYQEEE